MFVLYDLVFVIYFVLIEFVLVQCFVYQIEFWVVWIELWVVVKILCKQVDMVVDCSNFDIVVVFSVYGVVVIFGNWCGCCIVMVYQFVGFVYYLIGVQCLLLSVWGGMVGNIGVGCFDLI